MIKKLQELHLCKEFEKDGPGESTEKAEPGQVLGL